MTKKIIAIVSSVLVMFGPMAAPVLAIDGQGTTLEITGNGTGSNNVQTVTVTQTTQVNQVANADIENNINSSSNSGGNDANYNTGGEVEVNSGDSTTDVKVVNNANSNVAVVDDCNCGLGDVSVKIANNGVDTNNTAIATLQNTVTVGQTADADIDNNVRAKSNSGDNDANFNTGGSVKILSGNALTKVALTTDANQNLALVGGGNGNGGSASVIIADNGVGSDNAVVLGLTDWVVLNQAGYADVENNVYAKANSGDNEAKYNTGGSSLLSLLDGEVNIESGNSTTDVKVDNAVNFNAANIDCDCIMDVTAKIAGNGASHGNNTTDSTIVASLVSGQQVGQASGGEGVDNNLTSRSKSGYNDANSNTTGNSDPSIMTGHAVDTTWVKNQGNSNVFGDMAGDSSPFPWDWNWHNSNVSITFDLSQLIAALGL